MPIITLEDHYATKLFREVCPLPDFLVPMLDARGRKIGGIEIEKELQDFTGTRIAAMDAAGIDMQVISLTMPGTEDLPPDIAIPVARDANDQVADAVRQRPDRLAGFATLPTADPKAAAAELERAVTKLGLKGANINGNVRGEYLDDKKFWPIFECANALRVPIYLHPRDPHPAVMKAYFSDYPELAMAGWGFAMETCTHYFRLVFSGLFDAFPDFKIILGHMGEGVPFWLHRLNDQTELSAKRRGLKKSPAQYLREHLVITTSDNFYTPALRCAIDSLGIDNVLFSVDWPYESNQIAADWLKQLPLSAEEMEKLTHLNAKRLLRLD